MKKIVKKLELSKAVKLIICIVVASVLLSSCDDERETLENYKGGVVYDKKQKLRGDSFDILKDKKFYVVFVYRYEYDLYKLGDTIK